MLIRFLLLLLFALTGLARAEEPLPPEQAFRFSARAIDARTIEARWQITDQYYMYRDKFKFVLEGGTLGAAKLPPGKIKEDEIFGKVETYRKEVKILLPVEATGPVTLKAISQGCWDGGICYPPINQEAKLELAAAASTIGSTAPLATPVAVPPAPTPAMPASAPPVDESSRIAGLFKGDNFALVLLSFFGFGLLLSLTPCVFPMIPILSGIIVNHGHAVSHLRAFVLSLAYVLGMAVTYAAVGVAAGQEPAILAELWKFDCNPAGYRSRGGVPIDYWALVRGAKKDLDKDGMLVSPCEIIGTPVIEDGRIYVGIGQDPVHGPGRGALSCIALDGDRGDVTASNRVWQYLGIGRSLSTVSIVDGLVYAAEHAGKVHCLDAKTGSLVWVHDTRDEIWSSTFVVDGKVFIGTRKGLTILRAGRERGHVADLKLGTPVWSVPTAANGTLFVASQKNLWAVAAPTDE